VTTTEAIRTCVENAERQVQMFSQRLQWTPLLLVISIFACENTHSVALGLDCLCVDRPIDMHNSLTSSLLHA